MFMLLGLFLCMVQHLDFTEAFTINNYEVRDLEETTLSYFTAEVSMWQTKNLQINSNTSYCSTSILLGGYGVSGSGSTFSRTYTSMPTHNLIIFSIKFWLIDISSNSNLFQVFFDDVNAGTWGAQSIGLVTYLLTGSICGGSGTDYPSVTIQGQVPHTNNNLNQLSVKIKSLVSGSGTNSFGFRDVNLLFKNSTSQTNSVCSLVSTLNSKSSCFCQSGTYDPSGLATCTSCNEACSSCTGPNKEDCTSCQIGYSFDGGSCFKCSSSCEQCIGTASNNCVSCYSDKFLYWNGTCQSTCSSPLVQNIQGTNKICQLPCESNEYLYQNNSCQSSCDSNFKSIINQDGIQYCNFYCPLSSYLYWNNTCLDTCQTPYLQRIQGIEKYCDLPCQNSEYFYQNNTCLPDCSSPYIQFNQSGISYCTLPCANSFFLYPNETCLESCDSPFIPITGGSVLLCQYPCSNPVEEYLYQNGTCLPTCNSPYTIDSDQEIQLCQPPCNNTEPFFYENNTCQSSCEFPFLNITMGGQDLNLCNSPCGLTQFYLQDTNSCTSTCDSPSEILISGLLKTCIHPSENNTISAGDPAPNNNTDSNTISAFSVNDTNSSSSSDQESQNVNQNSTTITGFSKAVQTVVQASSYITMIIRPNNQNSAFMVALAKILKYIIFIDLSLPETLISAFESKNSTVGSLSTTFTYDMPEKLRAQFQLDSLPQVFRKNNIHSSYLVNQWNTFSTFSILFLTGIFFSALELLARKYASHQQLLLQIVVRLKMLTKWNFLICLFMNNYDDLTFFLILEFYSLRLNSFPSILSFLISILATFIGIYVLIITFKVNKQRLNLTTKILDSNHLVNVKEEFYKKWGAYQVLYSGVKSCSRLQQFYLLIFTCRIILCYIIIGFLYTLPLVQTILLNLISFTMIIYLLKKNPIKDKFNTVIALTYEALIWTANLCILIIAILNSRDIEANETRERLYQCILITNTLIQMFSNIFLWGYLITGAYSAYHASRHNKGIQPKTSWLNLLIVIYTNPGMDFDDQSNADSGVKEKSKKLFPRASRKVLSIITTPITFDNKNNSSTINLDYSEVKSQTIVSPDSSSALLLTMNRMNSIGLLSRQGTRKGSNFESSSLFESENQGQPSFTNLSNFEAQCIEFSPLVRLSPTRHAPRQKSKFMVAGSEKHLNFNQLAEIVSPIISARSHIHEEQDPAKESSPVFTGMVIENFEDFGIEEILSNKNNDADFIPRAIQSRLKTRILATKQNLFRKEKQVKYFKRSVSGGQLGSKELGKTKTSLFRSSSV